MDFKHCLAALAGLCAMDYAWAAPPLRATVVREPLSAGAIRVLMTEQAGAIATFVAVEGCAQFEAIPTLPEQQRSVTFWMGSLAEQPCIESNDSLGDAVNRAFLKARLRLTPVRIHGVRGTLDALTAGSRVKLSVGGAETVGPIDPELLMLRVENLDGQTMAVVVAGAIAMESGGSWAEFEGALRTRIPGAADALLFVASPLSRSLSRWGSGGSTEAYLAGVAGRWAEVAQFGAREKLKGLSVAPGSGGAKAAILGRWVVLSVPFPLHPSVSLYLKEKSNGVPLVIVGDTVAPMATEVPQAGHVRAAGEKWIPKQAADVAKSLEKPFKYTARNTGEARWDFESYDLEDRWRPEWRVEIRSPALIDGMGRAGGRGLFLDGGSFRIARERNTSTGGSVSVWLRVPPQSQDRNRTRDVALLEGNGIHLSITAREGFLQFQGMPASAKLVDNAWNHVGVTVGATHTRLYLNGKPVARARRTLSAEREWTIGGSGAIRIDDLLVSSRELDEKRIQEILRRPLESGKSKEREEPFPGDNPFPMQPSDPDFVSHPQPN
jgi:hypothetical protein